MLAAVRRRPLFALLPVLVLLAAAEVAGRTLAPPPEETASARTYDPSAAPLVQEPDGAWTFAAPDLFRPQRWTTPTDAFRVVVVGDSTVYGQLPDALAQGLSVPGRAVEVLNFGLRGAASDRARILADAAFAQDADLVVVYVGHNEVTEARLNPVSLRSLGARRTERAFLRSGIGRLLAPVVAPLRTDRDAARVAMSAKGDAAAVPVSDAEWAEVERSYRRNLEGICDARGAVPLVLVEPVSSLLARAEGPAEDPARATVEDAVDAGFVALRSGDAAGALAWADRLLRDFPDRAPALSLRGQALVALGRRDEGVDVLRAARAGDAHPVRATERHHAVVREVAAGCGAAVAAPEAAFLADPRTLAPGDPLFQDPVHPTVPGSVLLAGTIAAAAPLPAGARWDPAAVRLVEPRTEAERGWRIERAPDVAP